MTAIHWLQPGRLRPHDKKNRQNDRETNVSLATLTALECSTYPCSGLLKGWNMTIKVHIHTEHSSTYHKMQLELISSHVPEVTGGHEISCYVAYFVVFSTQSSQCLFHVCPNHCYGENLHPFTLLPKFFLRLVHILSVGQNH